MAQEKPWEHNLISVGSVHPPPKTNENATFTRDKYEPVHLSVADYRKLRKDGFVKIEALIPEEMSVKCRCIWTESSKEGNCQWISGDRSLYAGGGELARFSRVHNAHRVHALHERFLLHPRILDALEQLNGPDGWRCRV